MNSVTKTKVSNDKIKEIIEYYFPEDEIENMEELKDGMQNSAWIIVLKNNPLPKKLVLKIGVLPDANILRYEKDNLCAEKEFYNKAESINLPTPKLYVYDDTKKFLQSTFMIISYIEGTTWISCLSCLTDENKKQLLYQLGKYTAKIHSITGEKFGYVRSEALFLFDTWYEAFGAMLKAILDDGRERGFDLPYERIDNLLKQYKDILNEIKKPHLVDFDLWAGNIMLTNRERPDIVGIFDFGNSFYGDPFAEFVTAIHLYKDVRDEKEFQKGYSEVTGRPFKVTKNDCIRMKLYQLYLDLILYVESYRYDKSKRRNQERMRNKICMEVEALELNV